MSLATSLHQLREALRERLPLSVVDKDNASCLQVDALYKIDSRSFYIEGWSRSESRHTRLLIISPEGWSVDLTDRVYRYARPDVADFFGEFNLRQTNNYGFISYFELPPGTALPTGWIMVAQGAAGSGVEVSIPAVISDERLVRDSIVGDVVYETLPEDRLRRLHLLPALVKMQRRMAEEDRDPAGRPIRRTAC